MAERVSSVIFVCGRNSVRSPMARALTEHLLPGRLYSASAGIAPGDRDPFVDAVLAEIGAGIGDHRPRALDEIEDLAFDLAVTLAPEAHHRMIELTRTQAIEVEYWPMPDPTGVEGSRQQILAAYRALRERLASHVVEKLGPRAVPVHSPTGIG